MAVTTILVIIGVGLLIGATTAATAQHAEFGVKGGLNLSNFNGNKNKVFIK